MITNSIKGILRPLYNLFRRIVRSEWRGVRRYFIYDALRFFRLSRAGEEAALAPIIVDYHVVEKGLTMPARRLGFGREAVKRLVARIAEFEQKFGCGNGQWRHAVGVVRAYVDLHRQKMYSFDDAEFLALIDEFDSRYSNLPVCRQAHVSKDGFYSNRSSPFYEFALSRHTIRHYMQANIDVSRIKSAVELAMTAPSACNRQHVRVRCIVDRDLMVKVLEIQGGNRGFGHLADKLLVVSADLRDCLGAYERNDGYINGGIFTMNLCYALHFYGIAHCILSCSLDLDRVKSLRWALDIPEYEVLVVMVACGEAPEEFDVATSPRRRVDEILNFI